MYSSQPLASAATKNKTNHKCKTRTNKQTNKQTKINNSNKNQRPLYKFFGLLAYVSVYFLFEFKNKYQIIILLFLSNVRKEGRISGDLLKFRELFQYRK